MAIAVELPELGESVVEGTVSRWLVKEGDAVEVDQPLVEVTTDKVDAEIPAPSAGVVQKILVAEGDVVQVGEVLVQIDPEGSASSVAPAQAAAPPVQAAAPAVQALPSVAPDAAPTLTAVPDPSPEAAATPVARRLAESRGVPVDEIAGSGSGGRVTKADVLEYAAPPSVQRAPAPAAPPRQARPAYAQPELGEGDRVIPMTQQRRLIAQHMVYSKRTAPHVGTVAEVDMSEIVRLRAANKKSFQATHGTALTYLPFIVAATVRALREYPALNASVAENAIIERRDVHISLAVETDKGLVAPALRYADRLSLAGIATGIDDLSTRARNKKLSADELRGGTFTISNPGRQGNLYGFAIINQPQVGILRIGELVKRPVVKTVDGEDAIVIRTMMHLALSYDHRAVDGQPANGFLYRVREILEAAEFEL